VATLLVGFDSAWTPGNWGAIVAALQHDDGSFRDLEDPDVANFDEAESAIRNWQAKHAPICTVILLDQPTIVVNSTGQRPVENIVSSPVSLRYGGMQPAYTGRADMFGLDAPVWSFIEQFGGAADPLAAVVRDTVVFETYPVLTMIALGWLREDSRVTGRLPKYNPERRKTFTVGDWQYVCSKAAPEFRDRGLTEIARWLEVAHSNTSPKKTDQDKLDACLCLLVALHLAERRDCLMVGDQQTGYIVVPHGPHLQAEMETRCSKTTRLASDWVRTFKLGKA
jgi:predicted RNase H-like nuclease